MVCWIFLGTKFSNSLIKTIKAFLFKKMLLNISSAKWPNVGFNKLFDVQKYWWSSLCSSLRFLLCNHWSQTEKPWRNSPGLENGLQAIMSPIPRLSLYMLVCPSVYVRPSTVNLPVCLSFCLPRSAFLCVSCCFCPWASCQIRKMVGCACAWNAGDVFPATADSRSRHASRPVRDACAVMHAGIAN